MSAAPRARAAALRAAKVLGARRTMRLRRAVAALRGRDRIPRDQELAVLDIPVWAPGGGVAVRSELVTTLRDVQLSPAATLVIALGWSADELATLTTTLRERARAEPLRVLLLTDNDAFASLRRAGVLFEFVPPASDWTRLSGVVDYDVFLTERLDEIIRSYRPERILPLTAPEELDRLPPALLRRVESIPQTPDGERPAP